MNQVEVVNQARTAIDEERIAALVRTVLVAEGVDDAEVAVLFVGERRMRELNREHRGRDAVTDVLSFPLEDWGGAPEPATPPAPEPDEAGVPVAGEAAGRAARPPGSGPATAPSSDSDPAGPPLLLGDIVICTRRALRQARAGELPASLEVAVLLAHGTLHLLGYDHEVDAGRMALRQAEVLELVDWEGLIEASPR